MITTVKHPAPAASSTGPSTVEVADRVRSHSSKPVQKTFQMPEKVISDMAQIRDDLYRIEDQQMFFIDQLEVTKNLF